MKSIIFSFFCLCFASASFVHAQTTGADTAVKTTYIDRMADSLTFKLGINNNLRAFEVNSNIKTDIVPNNRNVLRLSANYRWLSASYSTAPDFIPGNSDDQLRGKTSTAKFGLNFNFNHWMQHFSYSRVKGYYLANTKDFNPSWLEGDPYVQFPDLVYKGFSGSTAYKFNRNFSFNAVTTQTERQLKSAGTFIPSLHYTYYIVDDRTPLTSQNATQKSNNLEFILSPGYIYTFVFQESFYATVGAYAGAGLIHSGFKTRTSTQTSRNSYTAPVYRFEGMAALGYNGRKFFAGVQLDVSDVGYKQSRVQNVIVNENVIYEAFVGIRLAAPKNLKEMMDKLDRKIAMAAAMAVEKKNKK